MSDFKRADGGIVICPECGASVSEKLEGCPLCGTLLQKLPYRVRFVLLNPQNIIEDEAELACPEYSSGVSLTASPFLKANSFFSKLKKTLKATTPRGGEMTRRSKTDS